MKIADNKGNALIYVLECDHTFQSPKPWVKSPTDSFDPSPRIQKNKDLFRDKIEKFVLEHPATCLVAEEWKVTSDEPTFANAVAERRRIKYININIPAEDYASAGIPENYHDLPWDQKRPLYPVFERYFYRRIREGMDDCTDVLIISGRDHASSMVDRFANSGLNAQLIECTEDEGFVWKWYA